VNPLLIIVPTRSRPQNVGKVVDAWLETAAFGAADLLFAIDFDDPAHDEYLDALQHAARAADSIGATIGCHSSPVHRPLVTKLNAVALLHAELEPSRLAIGFAGDDHLPRTAGWAQIFDDHLRRAGTGIVYGDDGYQGENLASSWVMTADIVRALGRMVPAPVDHLYCDNAIMDLGRAAQCLAYLPGVVIEHVHPVAGKTETDEQYERVNGREQYRRDRPAYRRWKRDGGLIDDVARVRALIKGKTA
jgi:hypothetical protein